MDLQLSNDLIYKALFYYEITNLEYQNNCLNCYEIIKSNKKIYSKFFEVYQKLYSSEDNCLDQLWDCTVEDLFGEDYCLFLTNLLLLLGFEHHEKKMKSFQLDEEQIEIHKKRVKECLQDDIYNRNYDSIRISQMLWGCYFIQIRLIEVGRLQFEVCDNFIKIHIPAGEKLILDEVLESIEESKKLIEKYYKKANLEYHCNSWLLSKQVKELLNPTGNIYQFQSLFVIVDGERCTKDILNFVFHMNHCNQFEQLPEITSLQRSLKDMLINDIPIYTGIGVLNDNYGGNYETK